MQVLVAASIPFNLTGEAGGAVSIGERAIGVSG
jgi:hypothetical protein